MKKIYKKTSFEFDIYGQEVTATKLVAPQVRDYQAEMTKVIDDEEKVYEVIKKYLKLAGIPHKITDQMEVDHLHELLGMVTGTLGK